MKLIYLGTGLIPFLNNQYSIQEIIGDIELVGWEPPDIETPYWELHFDGNISIYTDGRVVMIVKNEKVKEGEGKEKVVRMKRTE